MDYEQEKITIWEIIGSQHHNSIKQTYIPNVNLKIQ